VISITNTVYYRLGAAGGWSQAPTIITGTAGIAAFLLDPRKILEAAVNNTKNVTLGKPDTINGKPMLVLNYAPTGTEDPNQSSGTLWIGATDGLPYRLTDNDPNGSTASMNFDYTTPIKIEPPAP
jgi:hypothetical protein